MSDEHLFALPAPALPQLRPRRASFRVHNTGHWTSTEHAAFLSGLAKYPVQNFARFRMVAAIVGTRTPSQTRTHAQKYFESLVPQVIDEANPHRMRRKTMMGPVGDAPVGAPGTEQDNNSFAGAVPAILPMRMSSAASSPPHFHVAPVPTSPQCAPAPFPPSSSSTSCCSSPSDSMQSVHTSAATTHCDRHWQDLVNVCMQRVEAAACPHPHPQPHPHPHHALMHPAPPPRASLPVARRTAPACAGTSTQRARPTLEQVAVAAPTGANALVQACGCSTDVGDLTCARVFIPAACTVVHVRQVLPSLGCVQAQQLSVDRRAAHSAPAASPAAPCDLSSAVPQPGEDLPVGPALAAPSCTNVHKRPLRPASSESGEEGTVPRATVARPCPKPWAAAALGVKRGAIAAPVTASPEDAATHRRAPMAADASADAAAEYVGTDILALRCGAAVAAVPVTAGMHKRLCLP